METHAIRKNKMTQIDETTKIHVKTYVREQIHLNWQTTTICSKSWIHMLRLKKNIVQTDKMTMIRVKEPYHAIYLV